jgi:beta-galactosidase
MDIPFSLSILDALDIAGYNFALGRYAMEEKKHPDRLIFSSETFPQNLARNWEMVKKLPYLIGDFMWTAWDYLGEAGLSA